MPELPEVETVCRALQQCLIQRQITAIDILEPRLRWPVDETGLQQAVGQSVVHISRRAKYLLLALSDTSVLLVHLGMSGALDFVSHDAPYKRHDHVVFRLEGNHTLRYNDPRRFGMIERCTAESLPHHPRLHHLGQEPLQISPEQWLALQQGPSYRKAVKPFLLDGRQLAGIGNIYACEALYQAGIWPWQPVGQIHPTQWLALRVALQKVLEAAIQAGGTTLRDFHSIRGEVGYFSVALVCYGQEHHCCPRCTTPIARVVQQGRSTFFCPTCQPPMA